jgi:hypothetical protein
MTGLKPEGALSALFVLALALVGLSLGYLVAELSNRWQWGALCAMAVLGWPRFSAQVLVAGAFGRLLAEGFGALALAAAVRFARRRNRYVALGAVGALWVAFACDPAIGAAASLSAALLVGRQPGPATPYRIGDSLLILAAVIGGMLYLANSVEAVLGGAAVAASLLGIGAAVNYRRNRRLSLLADLTRLVLASGPRNEVGWARGRLARVGWPRPVLYTATALILVAGMLWVSLGPSQNLPGARDPNRSTVQALSPILPHPNSSVGYDYRLATTSKSVGDWLNSITSVSQTGGNFPTGRPGRDLDRMLVDGLLGQMAPPTRTTVTAVANQLEFVADWWAVRWVLTGRAGGGEPAWPLALTQPSFRPGAGETSYLTARLYMSNSVGPILEATDAPTVLFVGSTPAYRRFLDILALAGITSRELVPIYAGGDPSSLSSRELALARSVLVDGESGPDNGSRQLYRLSGPDRKVAIGPPSLSDVLASDSPARAERLVANLLDIRHGLLVSSLGSPVGISQLRMGPAAASGRTAPGTTGVLFKVRGYGQGWSAAVDGQPVETYLAGPGMMWIPLTAANRDGSSVTWTYHRPGQSIALGILAGMAVLMLAWSTGILGRLTSWPDRTKVGHRQLE